MSEASKALAVRLAEAAYERKAQNLSVRYVGDLVDYADYFVIASARSARHAVAVGEFVLETVKKAGGPLLGIEGLPNGQWILIDCGSVLVHIFHAPVRAFYALDDLWQDAPLVDVAKPEWASSSDPAGYGFELD